MRPRPDHRARQDRWCGCLAVQTPRAAARDLVDELGELVAEPSLDEWSDCWFAVSRLLGSLARRPTVPMPFTGRHWRKIGARMDAHGCVRSVRHLRDGRCPSSPPPKPGAVR